MEWMYPFGLRGAGYSFQRLMSTILGKSNFMEALCYLDDILVWGRNWREHMVRLRSVLQKVKSAGLALSPSKCKFAVDEVEYLGCIVKNGMLCLSEQRVQQLRTIKRPNSVQDLRRALGAFAYLQRWVPGLAEMAIPLYAGITGKKYARLNWTDDMDSAFERIKDGIATATALHIPDNTRPFVLVTDCSDMAAGAMLAQRDTRNKNDLCPVAYFHHALSKAEQKYSTTEKELLAVVYAVKKYRVYLSGKFQLITDHHALKWLNTLNPHDQHGRLGRWIEFLQQFNFEPTHKAGRSPELTMADFLSRVTASGDYRSDNRTVAVAKWNACEWATTMFSLEELRTSQANDQVTKAILEIIRHTQTPEWRQPAPDPSLSPNQKEEIKQILKNKERLFVDSEGTLRLRFNGGKKSIEFPFGKKQKNRIVVPLEMRTGVLQLSHDSPMAGHMGVNRTWQKVRDNFWWVNMKNDVIEYINNCDRCGRNKHWNHSTRPPLQRTDIPNQPLDKIQVDYLGPFPVAETHEYRYALQIQDVLSRFLMFIPCTDSTAETAAQMVVERWLCTLSSYPKVISSDRGGHFTSSVFESMCELSGIKHKMGAPGHPQSQGQVERQQQLLNQVRSLCNNDVELWPQAILRIQYSHNTSPSLATGISPAALVLGVNPVLPEDLATENSRRRQSELNDFEDVTTISRRKEKDLKLAIKRAKDNIMYNQDRRIDHLNEDNQCEQYTVGQRVRYKLTGAERNVLGGKKMAPRNSDQYVIRRVLPSGWTYELDPLPGSRGDPKIRNHVDLIPGPRRPPDPEPEEFMNEVGVGNLYNDDSSEDEQILDDDEELSDDSADGNDDRETLPLRTSRNCRPPQRLQVNPQQKKYDDLGYPLMDESDSSE